MSGVPGWSTVATVIDVHGQRWPYRAMSEAQSAAVTFARTDGRAQVECCDGATFTVVVTRP